MTRSIDEGDLLHKPDERFCPASLGDDGTTNKEGPRENGLDGTWIIGEKFFDITHIIYPEDLWVRRICC